MLRKTEASSVTPMFPDPVTGGMMIQLSEIDNRKRSKFGESIVV